MARKNKEEKLMAAWDIALAQIEEQSRKMLEKRILGDGGNPRSNGIISQVNWHCQEALNVLNGSLD